MPPLPRPRLPPARINDGVIACGGIFPTLPPLEGGATVAPVGDVVAGLSDRGGIGSVGVFEIEDRGARGGHSSTGSEEEVVVVSFSFF